jgi:hypothetical protein
VHRFHPARESLSLKRLPASLGRRSFLKLAGATAAAVGLYPLLGGTRLAGAQESPVVKVLMEDLSLNANSLAAGSLNGVLSTPRGILLAAGRAGGEYASPVLTAQTPFTHIGLHWVAEEADGLSFEVRRSVDGQAWSEWEAVVLEAHTYEATGQETFGALIGADRAARVQFRTVFEGGGRQPLLQSATVTLINSVDGPTSQSLDASPIEPILTSGGSVYSRGEWGADEDLRFSGGSEIWHRMFLPVKKAAVHHTATTNNYTTLEGAKAEVRAIYAYHAVTLGWGDIGYNQLIDKWGNVYEGRHGRGAGSAREVLSPGVVAGHALNFNYGSFGSAYLGTCTKAGEGAKPGVALSTAARTSLVDVLAWECDRHDIDPEGVSDYLLSNDAWDRGQPNIGGHRDCAGNSTICPGGYIYDQLPSLRVDVAARIASRKTETASLMPPSVDTVPVNSVGALEFSWSGTGTGFQILLEGWRRQPGGSEDLDYLCGFDSNGDGSSDIEPYPDWDPDETDHAMTFGELFNQFAPPGTVPSPGHYTFHVVAVEGSAVSYRREHTLLVTAAVNSSPTVQIDSPASNATFESGSSILFAGSASDPEDGDLTADLVWTSSKDGQIGTGGSFSAILSDGDHVVTATVTDSAGASGSKSVSIKIGSASTAITLSATGYKVQGLQKADLEWTGADMVDVWRSANGGSPKRVASGATSPYTDHINVRGGGSYTYYVESGSLVSNEVTVAF